MFDGILQKFADRAPTTVMVRGLLEQLLNAERPVSVKVVVALIMSPSVCFAAPWWSVFQG